KCNRAIFSYGHVHPIRDCGIHGTEIDLSRRAVERLDPEGRSCAVVAPEEQRFAIGNPDGAQDIAIERACEIRSFAASGGGHKYLILIVKIPVAPEPIGDL